MAKIDLSDLRLFHQEEARKEAPKDFEPMEERPTLHRLQREADHAKHKATESERIYKEYQENIKASESLQSDILKGIGMYPIETLFLTACKCIGRMIGDSGVFYMTAKNNLEVWTDKPTDKSTSPYAPLYRDVLSLHEQFDPPTGQESYWTEFAKAISAMSSKYDNAPFAKELITAVYTEQERKYKALQMDATGQEEEDEIPPSATERPQGDNG